MPISQKRNFTKQVPHTEKKLSAYRVNIGVSGDCSGVVVGLSNAAGEIFADAHLDGLEASRGLLADLAEAIVEIELEQLMDIALPSSTLLN